MYLPALAKPSEWYRISLTVRTFTIITLRISLADNDEFCKAAYRALPIKEKITVTAHFCAVTVILLVCLDPIDLEGLYNDLLRLTVDIEEGCLLLLIGVIYYRILIGGRIIMAFGIEV